MLALLATMALPAVAQSGYDDGRGYDDDDYGRNYHDDDDDYGRNYHDDDDDYDRNYHDDDDDYDRDYYDNYDEPRDPQCGWYANWDNRDEWWEYWCFWPNGGWEFVFWSW
jgi:hypothetical protein